MAEEKKDGKKEDKKDSKKKGITAEDVVLLTLGIITIFFVIIPQLVPDSSVVDETTGQPIISSGQNDTGVVGIYKRIFGQKTEQIIGPNGQVQQVVVGPSIVDEAKFRLTDIFNNIFIFLAILSVFLSAFFGIMWYYNGLRIKIIAADYNKKIGFKVGKDPELQPIPVNYVPDTNGLRNPKWELVEKYYHSGNQSDWRVAIIEADILLFEVLQTSGFKGDTIGEMLKNTNTAQLQTLQIAWKSHLIRNRLAHDGASLHLTRHMVEEAIEGFRAVFTELNFI